MKRDKQWSSLPTIIGARKAEAALLSTYDSANTSKRNLATSTDFHRDANTLA
ncbi:MAG TPA: hypothetical protein VJU86_22810 [Pyrinomonadaceae bacterium]|nr:hypothetical protein [Pyrinomonadaceae bacterium]